MEVIINPSLEGKVYDTTQYKQLTEDLKGEITLQQINNLAVKAETAKNQSYSPYSKFRVGCCLLSKKDEYFQGKKIKKN
jgi:cytidine deaminase